MIFKIKYLFAQCVYGWYAVGIGSAACVLQFVVHGEPGLDFKHLA